MRYSNNNLNNKFNGRVFISNPDLIIESGYYSFTIDTINIPHSGYGLLNVKKCANGDWIYQEITYTDTVNQHKYHRMKINDGEWCEWELEYGNSMLKNTNIDEIKNTSVQRIFDAVAGILPFGSIQDNDFILYTKKTYNNENLGWQIALDIRSDSIKARRLWGNNWGKWNSIIDTRNLRHQRETIKSGTIYSFIAEKLKQEYTGGEIEINGMVHKPTDTFNNVEWGIVNWIATANNIVTIFFYPDWATQYGYRSIVPSENYDSGWVIK